MGIAANGLMIEFSSPYVAPLNAIVATVMNTDVLQIRVLGGVADQERQLAASSEGNSPSWRAEYAGMMPISGTMGSEVRDLRRSINGRRGDIYVVRLLASQNGRMPDSGGSQGRSLGRLCPKSAEGRVALLSQYEMKPGGRSLPLGLCQSLSKEREAPREATRALTDKR